MTQDFLHCKMEYGKDEQGRDVLLKEGKFQVMMEWEKPYMHACIDNLKPFGDVLEIGFGLGYSAERIQSFAPKSYTIVEYHPEVALKARAFAAKYPHVTIIEDTWQHALSSLGTFDCIFFDDYPLQSEEEMQQMEKESAHSTSLLNQGDQILQSAHETLPMLRTLKYSDADLLCLMQEIPAHDPALCLQFAKFLIELCADHQITETQVQNAFKILVDEKKVSEDALKALKKEEAKDPFSFSRKGDRLFQFLSQCLKSHMRKGSRFSCFLSSSVSTFEDDQFLNEVIVNPFLDFREEEIVLEVPENCTYFSGNRAFVITITKMG